MLQSDTPARRLKVAVSDPWEFTSRDGSNTFAADVWDSPDGDAYLLRLIPAAHIDGRDWVWFAAVRGSEGDVRMYGLTEEQARADWASFPGRWRGGTPAARAVLSSR